MEIKLLHLCYILFTFVRLSIFSSLLRITYMALIIIMILNITGFWVSSMVCVTSSLIVQLESWPVS